MQRKQKNQLFLLDIFKCIHEKRSDSVLWIIGDGPDREKIENGIKERNLEDCVKLLGVRSDVRDLYNGMDIFLLPSLFEGLPVVMVEAQSNGLKCYASDGVPQQAKMIETVEYISLKENAETWADIILNGDHSRCPSAVESINKKGFGIRTEVGKMEEKLLG